MTFPFDRPDRPCGQHVRDCLLTAPPSFLNQLIAFTQAVIVDGDDDDLVQVMGALQFDARAAAYDVDDQFGELLADDLEADPVKVGKIVAAAVDEQVPGRAIEVHALLAEHGIEIFRHPTDPAMRVIGVPSLRMKLCDVGTPADVGGARALFAQSPFDFERWAVSLVGGTPNEKQVGDKGVDGVIRFPLSERGAPGRVLVSVKGGKQLNPSMVRDLIGTVEGERDATMGVLITIDPATKGMVDAANLSGSFKHPVTGTTYPKVQLMTVEELLAGKRPPMPTPYMPYLQAEKFVPEHPRLF